MSRKRKEPPREALPYAYRSMWVIAMFDLPTDSAEARRAYTRFRKDLLNDGFAMMQYSIYYRHCASFENADTHIRRMGACVPAQGEVRFVAITDKQFSRIQTFFGKKRQPKQESPAQLEFF